MKEITILIPETEEEKHNHDVLHNFVNMDGSLSESGEVFARLGIDLLNRASFRNSDAHGWYEELWLGNNENPKSQLAQRNFGEVIALIHSEISEALESYRNHEPVLWYGYKQMYPDGAFHNDPINFQPSLPDSELYQMDNNPEIEVGITLGKPEGVAAELADAIIRICDYAGAYGVPLSEAIVRKHAYNASRPYRHGGKAM